MAKKARRKPTEAQIKASAERRAELKALSDKAKMMYELNSPALADYQGDGSVNDLIMFLFYPEGEYNVAGNWFKQGKTIIKGSKGFSIWGKPRKFAKKADPKAEANKDEKDNEYKAFPVAYLFHESQVQEKEEKLKEVA